MKPSPRKITTVLLASLVVGTSQPVGAAGRGGDSPYAAAIAGAGFAAGDAIGAAAVGGQGGPSGYDGGAPTGTARGRGPASRPCFDRRPVYGADGGLIGYRGVQLC